MSDDLVIFLRARLDEDQRVARYSGGTGTWSVGDCVDDERREGATEWAIVEERYPVAHVRGNTRATHVARHDPARVLAEVEAKRRILELHTGPHECPAPPDGYGEYTTYEADCLTLKLLTLPYADHPDYREEWRP